MLFWLELNQEKDYGQIPVIASNGQVKFFIQGNLDNPNHTLYLNDINNKEVGRLFSDGAGLIASFTIDVVNHSLVGVKKLNTPSTNIFYLTQLNYIVTGSIVTSLTTKIVNLNSDSYTNLLSYCWIMNRLFHDLSLFIFFRLLCVDKAN